LRGSLAGCDEYLTKPLDEDRLLEVIAKFLPAPPSIVGQSCPIRINDLSMVKLPSYTPPVTSIVSPSAAWLMAVANSEAGMVWETAVSSPTTRPIPTNQTKIVNKMSRFIIHHPSLNTVH
jgi:hypothetical protein